MRILGDRPIRTASMFYTHVEEDLCREIFRQKLAIRQCLNEDDRCACGALRADELDLLCIGGRHARRSDEEFLQAGDLCR